MIAAHAREGDVGPRILSSHERWRTIYPETPGKNFVNCSRAHDCSEPGSDQRTRGFLENTFSAEFYKKGAFLPALTQRTVDARLDRDRFAENRSFPKATNANS